jgi:hypothetical protein
MMNDFSATASSKLTMFEYSAGLRVEMFRMVKLRRQHRGFIPENLQSLRRYQFKRNQRLPAVTSVLSTSTSHSTQPSARGINSAQELAIVSGQA